MARARDVQVEVARLTTQTATFALLGTSPLIFNSMSEKVRRYLLCPPPGKKTAAEKAANLKHDPLEEYRGSVYRRRNDKGNLPRLQFPATAVKSAIATAALEVPGAKKAQIGRLVWTVGRDVPIWGIPQMKMDVVRSADKSRTPDVRTRAIVVEWCTEVVVRFVTPTLTATQLANLLEAAGLVIGLGDFRQEKGKGNFGQFCVVGKGEEAAVARLKKVGGLKAQDAALKKPDFFDLETENLYTWYLGERKRRGK